MSVNVDGDPVRRGGSYGTGGDTGLRPSELFYCGKMKRECRCGTCDGRCGPTNGCPCNACYAMLQRSKSTVRNADGKSVFKGRPATDAFYCGKIFGYCACGTCDGRCGPTNGCMCSACAALSRSFNRVERVNVDGDRVYHGIDGAGGWMQFAASTLYYCGKLKYECQCGGCDGRCGLDSGCPCRACLALLLSEMATVRNSEGAPVWKAIDVPGGTSQYFYCGRLKNQCRCGHCDGRCGPKSGCPCNACYQLSLPETFAQTLDRLDAMRGTSNFHEIGQQVLMTSIASGDADATQKLFTRFNFDPNDTFGDGRTPLVVAAGAGHVDVVNVLVAQGARVDKVVMSTGASALYTSVRDRHVAVARRLLEFKADPDVVCGSDSSMTPLHVAAKLDDRDMVVMLLQAGANPMMASASGKVAKDVAPSSSLQYLLDKYTNKWVFDAHVSSILERGSAEPRQLQQLCVHLTSVYDLRGVVSITHSLFNNGHLIESDVHTVLDTAFQHAVENKLVLDDKALVFFRTLMKHCFQVGMLPKATYSLWKVRAAKANMENAEWVVKLQTQVHENSYRVQVCERHIDHFQSQFRQVANAYRELASSVHNVQSVIAAQSAHAQKVAKQKRTFGFLSMALTFVAGPLFNGLIDYVVDLTNPLELVSAVIDPTSIETFLETTNWASAVLNPAMARTLEAAFIEETDFLEMLHLAVEDECVNDGLMVHSRKSEPTSGVDHAVLATPRPPAGRPSQPRLASIVLQLMKTRLEDSTTDDRSTKDDEACPAAIKNFSDSAATAKNSALESTPGECTVLDDIDSFLYHSATQCSQGDLDEFREIVREIELEDEDVNARVAVRYADGSRGMVSPLEYACELGFVDIVKYFLDREDVVKEGKRAAYVIKAKRRSKLGAYA